MLAATDHYAAVLFAGSMHLLRMDDGTTIKTRSENIAHAAYMEASDDTLFVGASESMARITLPALGPVSQEKTPVAFNALAVNGERKLGASSSGRARSIGRSTDAQWRKLPLCRRV
jgi:hypothetical protein